MVKLIHSVDALGQQCETQQGSVTRSIWPACSRLAQRGPQSDWLRHAESFNGFGKFWVVREALGEEEDPGTPKPRTGRYSLENLAAKWDDTPEVRERLRQGNHLLRHWCTRKTRKRTSMSHPPSPISSATIQS